MRVVPFGRWLTAWLVLCPALAYSEDIHVTWTEVPYQESHGLMGLHFDLGPPILLAETDENGAAVRSAAVSGFGAGVSFTVGYHLVTLEFGADLRRYDTASFGSQPLGDGLIVLDFAIGARLHPLDPLLSFGDLTLRPTGGALIGYAMGNATNALDAKVSGGISFGWKDAPDFVTLELLWRPLPISGTLTVPVSGSVFDVEHTMRLEPSFWGRLSFVIGT